VTGDSDAANSSVASTVVTAFSIIEEIAARGKVLPQDLARSLGLNRATVHRMLYTLQILSYVAKHPDGTFRLTFHVFELGNTVPHSYNLINTARPAMIALAQETGFTVNYGILWEGAVLYVDKADPVSPLRFDRSIGETDPLHCTSLGKVILAFVDETLREKLLAPLKLTPSTPHTITDPAALRAEIELTRERRYAIDDRELSVEVRCVATPVHRSDGTFVAAVSVSAPADHLSIDEIHAMVPRLTATCERIGSELSATTSGG